MMKTSDADATQTCPRCGGTVPSEAPQGLCPGCVLAQAAAPEPAPTATSQIPSLQRLAVAFPQLQVLELIGRGGMGFVFKARQPHLDRFVALKLLPDSLAHDAHFAERFNREGRTLARLNHPNIVSVFDFGQAGGFYFLLMEYVDGVNLRQAMQAGRFSPAEALAIVPKICAALQFAHEEGVLHRDIKPENILLDAKGRVKIADFGIAKIVGDEQPDASLTATGAALGTLHYMAPEQWEKPGTVDHRADIYSLGVVFYELLTGELPIGRFALPSEKTPVDPRVDEVVMRSLEKEREKRFQSAGEVQTNVEHLTESGAGNFKAPPAPPKAAPAEGPRGTMVIKPENVVPDVPRWSQKSIWASVLVGFSLPFPLLLILTLVLRPRFLGWGWAELALLLFFVSVPGLAGTILGWMALSDIRAHAGKLRGLPLAVFAALALPLLALIAGTVMLPWPVVHQAAATGRMPAGALLLLLIPAGAITFALWAIYAAARWGGNNPAPDRRGMLKWAFVALLLAGGATMFLMRSSRHAQVELLSATEPTTNVETVPLPPADTAPWIQFTFIAVELREVAGTRWLAIDYLDNVHGEAQKAFPWETTIPGFKAETRTTEFLKDDATEQLARLGDSLFATAAELAERRLVLSGANPLIRALEARLQTLSNQLAAARNQVALPAVRHQRIEYRLPASADRAQLEAFRDEVAKRLHWKTVRLSMNEEHVLFELQAPEGGSFKARLKVSPPLGESPSRSAAGERPPALEFRLVAEAGDTNSPADQIMQLRNHDDRTAPGVPLRVLRTVLLDGSSVARAGIVLEPNGDRTISFELTDEGARQFGAVTAANLNRQLAIISDGQVLSAPTIRSPITGGEMRISGAMPPAAAHRLVAALNRTKAAFSFAEMIERSLPVSSPTGGVAGVNLASGNVVTKPSFAWLSNLRSRDNGTRTNSADLLVYVPAASGPVLVGFDMVIVAAPTNAWSFARPDDVIWNWRLFAKPSEPQARMALPGPTNTYFFRTRFNDFGILQAGSDQGSGEMKVRYKLVHTSGSLAERGRLKPLKLTLDEAQTAFAAEQERFDELSKLNDEQRFAALSILPGSSGLLDLRLARNEQKQRLARLDATSLPSERQALEALVATLEKQTAQAMQGAMLGLGRQLETSKQMLEEMRAELEKGGAPDKAPAK